MRYDDLHPGIRVKFTRELTEKYKNSAEVTWKVGEIARVVERTPAPGGMSVDLLIVSEANPYKYATHGGGLYWWVEPCKPSADVESGVGIEALKLPEPRTPYVCAVTDYDLLPDA